MMYTRPVLPNGNHVIDQNLALAQTLAQVPLTTPDAQFPSDPGVEEHVHQLLADKGLKKFAILNPGAGWGAKRWPAERYGQVARSLAKCGVQSVVNYGPGEEDLARAAEAASEGAARPFQCSISELIALTRLARLFVGGDT